MKTPPYFVKMASGDMAIILDDGVSYESFPAFAKHWADRLRLTIVRQVDGPAERIWECQREGCQFWLAFDDWFPEISLEPMNSDSNQLIQVIAAEAGFDETRMEVVNPFGS